MTNPPRPCGVTTVDITVAPVAFVAAIADNVAALTWCAQVRIGWAELLMLMV
eukprot:CAMPEP_0202817726 /NCGR_PEP_ID=MMETSP1389-20130828/7865_1 /ASSEMBLY_ACC=CAM_ASM_000865 /TAXON_ID=302021 /ORGANISM="Rhodomonas sp., Strain CCMP768" /LENGTH=51 /DNA_ID=CAMNT_0049489989 /DNA_START=20 /DNA_END=172 /DNA_ORIENTATION=+